MKNSHYFEAAFLHVVNFGICLMQSVFVSDFVAYCADRGYYLHGGAIETDAAGLTSQYLYL